MSVQAKTENAGERWRERIVETPGVLGGKPRIRGRRLSVEFVTGLLKGDSSESDIMRSYRIEREDFEACVRYKASGAKLSDAEREEIHARMDVEDAERERRELARLRKRAAESGERPNLWKTRIIRDPNILGGKPIVKGTRLSVEFIAGMVGSGETEESVARAYRIEPEDVAACVQYRAMGKNPDGFKHQNIERLMDKDADEQERGEIERLRALVAEWDRRAANLRLAAQTPSS